MNRCSVGACHLGRPAAAVAASPFALNQRRYQSPGKLFNDGTIDRKAKKDTSRAGPPTAHALPVYKTMAKIHQGARWKNANVITEVAAGKDYRLRDTHGEGVTDDTGVYRDWLQGEERRYANIIGIVLFTAACGLYYYMIRLMRNETWELPAPELTSKDISQGPKIAGKY